MTSVTFIGAGPGDPALLTLPETDLMPDAVPEPAHPMFVLLIPSFTKGNI
jgi:hypothetical protein